MAKKKKQEEEVIEQEVQEVVEQNIEKQPIEEMTVAEIKEKNAKELEAFKEEVSKINDEETLNKMEQAIIEDYNALDAVIKDRTYAIPESVVFNGAKFSKAQVATFIRKFINKTEVDFRTTLGMFQLYKVWVNPPVELTYGAFDSTLRILGQCKFKGYDEWEAILVINEYFKNCNEAYVKDTAAYDFLASKHQEVMNRMDLIAGHTEQADALEGVQK